MDNRFQQACKEAKLALLLTLVYLFIWAGCAYLLGTKPGLFGLPRWFEASCLFLPIAFVLLCCVIIATQFKGITLSSSKSK